MGFLVWKPGLASDDGYPVCSRWPACSSVDDGCEDCAEAAAEFRGVPAA